MQYILQSVTKRLFNMITPEIISYIKTERAKGTPDSLIASNLLANGWSESDIAEVMSSSSSLSDVSQPLMTDASLKERKKKAVQTTFFLLFGLDILVILGFRLFYGTYGIFGISILSILLRVVVICFISSFATPRPLPGDKTSKTVGQTALNIIGRALLAILIAMSIFLGGCLFMMSLFSHSL